MNLQEVSKDPTFRERYLQRLQAESSQMLLSNLALDVSADMLIEENMQLKGQLEQMAAEKAALLEKTTNDHDMIEQLRDRAEKAEGRKRAST